ncbi:WW domain-binding protein 11 [Senna tora]|uniref:WW domain-binding protein 11 n=1 Tax=Senna tora TaxID=362788 RepID=A0A834X4E9_9FABA|nr:WW domain-binding protein 11 [Senna tora]
MKTTKGGKVMNPTDAYRKELRKKELKRVFTFRSYPYSPRTKTPKPYFTYLLLLRSLENKKERKKVREVGILKKDPEQLKKQIENLEMMKADGALDKARKHKKRQLQDTLNLVLKKRKEYEDKMKEKGETPVMFSHLGLPRRRTTAEEEERVKHPKPEDSVYYHPTLNPTGAPPPGKPPMFKSSVGPRIPLSEASSSGAASSSMPESEDDVLTVPPPPPPPPPPLPDTSNVGSADGSVLPASLPLPPPPPMPPTPTTTANVPASLPPPPLPPPPPGPPPKELVANRPVPPPPPPLQQAQPPFPGTSGSEERNQSSLLDDSSSEERGQVSLPLPPPPSGMPPKSGASQSDVASVNADNKSSLSSQEIPKMVPGPPPPRQQPLVPGPTLIPTLQPDVLPPGISRFPPPPPPPDMRPPLSAPGLPGQAPPPGMMVPIIPRPPYGPPPGPPPMMRPPLPPGPPPNFQEEDHAAFRPLPPQKPSYVKSAASTVVKRPLAQHTPELTAMVPASVRVRRETAVSKPKPKSSQSSTTTTVAGTSGPTVVKPESVNLSSAPKGQSIDDSYMAFLEDMKALGALDS